MTGDRLTRCLGESPLSDDAFVGCRYGKVTGPAKYRVHGYQADLGDATSDLGLHGFDSSGGVTSIAVSSCSELAPDATALLMLASGPTPCMQPQTVSAKGAAAGCCPVAEGIC
eukprot:3937790-Rhodomonas_salina.5